MIGLFGLYFVYRQWADGRQAKLMAEEEQRKTELRLTAAKLADEINVSSEMLLIERSKLWAQALNRFPSDFVARSVLAAAAMRTTLSAFQRLEHAMAYAREHGISDELRRSFDNAMSILQEVGREDLSLVSHIADYDLRFSELSLEVRKELLKKTQTDAEVDMLAFQAQDGLIQTSQVFLLLKESADKLGKRAQALMKEMEKLK
ncbi:MAG: hypothetical protein DI604_20425 [Delftia acidovorans]|nr:MAG: hypothetical protein DI604_20425 [Delftia acidovorans]